MSQSSDDDATVELHHTITWDNASIVLDNEQFELAREQSRVFEPLLRGDWSEVSRGDQAGVERAMRGVIETLRPEIRAGLLADDDHLRRVWCAYIMALKDNNCIPRDAPACSIVSE